MINLFLEKIKDEGIELNERQISRFETYKKLVLEWNKKFNITSITDSDEFDLKHLYDCALLFKLDEIKNAKSIIDIGTGGGFPGIPLKILIEDADFLLIDGSGKRIRFLEHVIDELELKDIKAIHERAEIMARDVKYRDKFDIAVSRAVAPLNTLCEYCMPLVKESGEFIAMKGSSAASELKEAKNAINILNGSLKDKIDYTLEESDHNRSLILIKKEGKTPKKYPRAGGAPKNKPL
ncbi:MAG: 16S rRNA (guanine(527)-N(7))-methyltransferase RsmG [Tissierellia bacterium]|nr:16S rRNA (guanine(527)-N(7))-methyltransferase RsmG [Tissierellia bacterium]